VPILGRNIVGNTGDGNRFATRVLVRVPVGPLQESYRIVSGGMYGRQQSATTEEIFMVVYELNEASPELSPLVAQSQVRLLADFPTTDTWMEFGGWGSTVLEAGKSYLIGATCSGYGGNAGLPKYQKIADVGTSRIGPVVTWPNATDPFGSTWSGWTDRDDCIYLDVIELGPTIDSVSGIVDGAETVITGSSLQGVASITVGTHAITNFSEELDGTVVRCSAQTAYADTSIPYGEHTLTVITDSGSATFPVTWSPGPDKTLATGASIDSVYGLSQEGGADGDQWITFDGLSGSNVVLSDDTNLLITPAAIDGASQPYWRYSGGAWVQSSYIINGSGQGFEIWGFAAVTNAVGEVTLQGITGTLSGTVYGVVDASPTQPTKEQVRDGLNAAGAPALGKGSAAVTTADLSVTITGLPSDTLLYGWLAQWV